MPDPPRYERAGAALPRRGGALSVGAGSAACCCAHHLAKTMKASAAACDPSVEKTHWMLPLHA